MKCFLIAGSLVTVAVPATSQAQAASPAASAEQAMMGHIRAIEQSGERPLDELVREFERQRFAPELKARLDADGRRALLSAIREAAAQAGGVMVESADDGVVIKFAGPTQYEVTLSTSASAPYAITALSVSEAEQLPPIPRDRVESWFDAFMAEGRTGLVHVVIDGQVALHKAYGLANEALGAPITPHTVFGIGSRPIDFTIAALFLLEKHGKLSLDDTLADHFEQVPADRAGMTLRHIVNGQSGLPDFPANESDWDADLAWIDRDQFIARTMAVPLQFAPGEGRAHSHWAFGVAAAIVEKASGERYAAFLKRHFFDPAGMRRTGSYGETLGLPLEAFAVGGGKKVGLPNIPPNWGPTSWLVMGSGGMMSTLDDLLKFYAYVGREDVLGERARHFGGDQVQVDGSERGFELVSIVDERRSDQAWVFLTKGGGPAAVDALIEPLERFLRAN